MNANPCIITPLVVGEHSECKWLSYERRVSPKALQMFGRLWVSVDLHDVTGTRGMRARCHVLKDMRPLRPRVRAVVEERSSDTN